MYKRIIIGSAAAITSVLGLHGIVSATGGGGDDKCYEQVEKPVYVKWVRYPGTSEFVLYDNGSVTSLTPGSGYIGDVEYEYRLAGYTRTVTVEVPCDSPDTTAPQSTAVPTTEAPGTTAPASTVPATTAPQSTTPGTPVATVAPTTSSPAPTSSTPRSTTTWPSPSSTPSSSAPEDTSSSTSTPPTSSVALTVVPPPSNSVTPSTQSSPAPTGSSVPPRSASSTRMAEPSPTSAPEGSLPATGTDPQSILAAGAVLVIAGIGGLSAAWRRRTAG